MVSHKDAIEAVRQMGTPLAKYPTKSRPNGAEEGESIVTLRGIKYRQSIDAPVDGILIHPLVMAQMLSDTSSNEPVDVYHTRYEGEGQ